MIASFDAARNSSSIRASESTSLTRASAKPKIAEEKRSITDSPNARSTPPLNEFSPRRDDPMLMTRGDLISFASVSA
jgi:hypothetical protein